MKIVLLTALSVLALAINSCSKSPKCWGDDKNKGDIAEHVKIACQPLSGDRWIINNQNQYEQTFETECDPPTIDFTKYTLLGIQTSATCETKYIREVTREENGNAHYKVTVKSCGNCKKVSITCNWVTIPKIPDNAEVTFDVKEK